MIDKSNKDVPPTSGGSLHGLVPKKTPFAQVKKYRQSGMTGYLPSGRVPQFSWDPQGGGTSAILQHIHRQFTQVHAQPTQSQHTSENRVKNIHIPYST
jgi:hypothetical protein